MKHVSMIILSGVAPLFAGCGVQGIGTHTVSKDHDSFMEVLNGRTIEYQNWFITIEDKAISIEKTKSTTQIESTASRNVDVFFKGKRIHDE